MNSEDTHARCGRPWTEHREVEGDGGFTYPVCDDEYAAGHIHPDDIPSPNATGTRPAPNHPGG